MAISLTAEAIMLAINTATKLNDRLQRAYAESIKSKAILLPLPKFDTRPNFEKVHEFFIDDEDGKAFRTSIDRIQMLFDKKESSGLTGPEQDEYIDFYTQLKLQLDKDRKEGAPEDAAITVDTLISLLQVRQWEADQAPPRNSPLKLVAGTLVETGIDYFNHIPGAFDRKSPVGRVVQHFLSGLDEVNIAESPSLKAFSEEVIPQLFIATAESVATLSKDISGDEKVQAFIAATGKGIAADLIHWHKTPQEVGDAEDANKSKRRKEQGLRWGQLMLRTMVKNAGEHVFHAPADLLHTNAGVSRLIQQTGGVLLKAILEDPHKLDLKNGLNADTLDRLVRSALHVVAEHPKMISGRNGIEQIVVEVSSAVATSGIKGRPDLVPELVRLILEHTANNFHHIFKDGPEGGGESLLIMAVRELLAAISQERPGSTWKLHLPKNELLSIAGHILDEVVTNPDWVLTKLGDKTLLRETLEATFQALAGLPADQRLNRSVLEMIIKVNIQTVVINQAVLKRIAWGTDTEEKIILQRALDLVFHFVFESGQVAPAERIRLLTELLRYISEVILIHHPNEKGLFLIDMILFRDPDVDYSFGFTPELADELIDAALGVMQTYPELITGEVPLQNMLSGVAGALHASSFRQSNILPELLRLSLLYTGENIHLIISAEGEEPKHLLVSALQQLLAALSAKSDAAHWQPKLTGAQLLGITENIFDEIVHHPQWLVPDDKGHTVFGTVLSVTVQALKAMPKTERLQADTLEMILQLALSTVAGHPKLLSRISWGTEEEEAAILQHALNLTVSFVFERSSTTGGDRLQLFIDLLHFILEMLMSRHPDKKGLLLLDLVFFEDPDVDFSQGFQPELYDNLIQAGIRVLDYRPDLVTNDRVFQHLIEVVMGSLKASGYKRPGLLPDLLRLVLECTAENIQLIIKADDGTPRYLLAAALQSLLQQLSIRPATGDRWRPQLSVPQLLDIAEEALDFLVLHPHLVTEDLRDGTIFSEAVKALFSGLAQLPRSQRLQPGNLSWLLRSSLQSAVRSRELLGIVRWGSEEEETIILEKALELVFAYVFPADGPDRGDALEDLLEYTLEVILRQHQDKKALLLLYLILFEWPELGRRPVPQEEDADPLIQAGLELLIARPELISKDAVWQKIIRDTATALKNAKLDMPELLPEMLRLTLLHTAENVDLLTDVKPDSRQYVLTVAMEQCLRAIAQKPKRGKWKPQLSGAQILDIVEICLDHMLQNPLWTKDDLLEAALQSVFEALQSVPEARKLPYATVRLLIERGLQAVSFRKTLVIEVVHRQGARKVIALTYALEGLFVLLYDEDEATETASWTLTQTGVLESILDSFLQGLMTGPITKEAIKTALEPVEEAVKELSDNAAFSLEALLDELEQ